jgi:proton glutamate symport protein
LDLSDDDDKDDDAFFKSGARIGSRMSSDRAATPRSAKLAAMSTAITAAGGLLFAIGAMLPLVAPAFASHRVAFAGARWAGLILLGAVALKRRSLTFWIFWSMLSGAEIGLDFPATAGHLRLLSDIFLRLIRVIVAPLILSTLITGIAAHSDLRALKRIGIKSIVYFELVTTLALFIGVGAINISRAGVGLKTEATAAAQADIETQQLRWDDFVLHIFPENLAKSIADDQILQVVVFALLFGIALALVPAANRAPVLNFLNSLTQVMFRFTNIVMYFAPFGVGGAMAYTVGRMGTAILLPLAKLLLTAYASFAIFILVVLVPVAMWARVPLRRFLNAVAEPATIAFATSTSEAALPRAIECMEEFGVPREIVAFVIPAGYSFNLDGSTIYLAVASIFVAQVAGIHLGWSQQLAMVFTLMLTSKGVAGVPRAVLVVLLATASTFHLPTEPIFIILGIDALVDMGRTALNVIGNCLACAVIARSEGQLIAE